LEAATIKLFLVHGSPNGLRTGELSNWSGKAIEAALVPEGLFFDQSLIWQ